MRHAAATLASSFLVLATACSSASAPAATACTVTAAGYHRECSADIDCVLVPELYECGGCSCGSGAIDRSDLPAYEGAWQKVQADIAPCNCLNSSAMSATCCFGTCATGC